MCFHGNNINVAGEWSTEIPIFVPCFDFVHLYETSFSGKACSLEKSSHLKL